MILPSFEIYDVEEYRDLEIYIRGHSPCEFMYMADICIPGLSFAAYSTDLFSFTSTQQARDKAMSLNVIQSHRNY